MANDRRAEALALAEEIVSDFELGRTEVEALLMKCLRLAQLSRDEGMRIWILAEMGGYGEKADKGAVELLQRAGRLEEREDEGKTTLVYEPSSLPSLVRSLDVDTAKLSAGEKPEDIFGFGAVFGSPLASRVRRESDLVSRIRARIYDHVLRLSHGLKYSGYVASAFQRTRTAVDAKLKDVAPDALRQFAAAFDSGLSDNKEHWAQALASCRRILLSTANALFPARESEYTCRSGKRLKVGEADYLNRLHAFLDQYSPSETSRALLSAKVEALYRKSCKGVHDVVDEFELQLALTSTYFLVGELLALCPSDFAFGPALEGEVEAQVAADSE